MDTSVNSGATYITLLITYNYLWSRCFLIPMYIFSRTVHHSTMLAPYLRSIRKILYRVPIASKVSLVVRSQTNTSFVGRGGTIHSNSETPTFNVREIRTEMSLSWESIPLQRFQNIEKCTPRRISAVT